MRVIITVRNGLVDKIYTDQPDELAGNVSCIRAEDTDEETLELLKEAEELEEIQ